MNNNFYKNKSLQKVQSLQKLKHKEILLSVQLSVWKAQRGQRGIQMSDTL